MSAWFSAPAGGVHMTVEHERTTIHRTPASDAGVGREHTLTFDARIGRVREVVIDLGINAASVLVLMVALWVMRQQSGRGRSNDAPGLLQGEDG